MTNMRPSSYCNISIVDVLSAETFFDMKTKVVYAPEWA